MTLRGLRRSLRCSALAAVALVLSCATTGADGEGDVDLPTAGVGPFRKLDFDEVRGIAPFVLDEETAAFREPAALAEPDGGVVLYTVAARDGKDVLVRSRATDGRSFYGTSSHFGKKPPVVLEPDQPWEGGALSGPFALRVGAEILLFYAAAGGIGVARSGDGLHFTKDPGPILSRDPASAWETTELRAPSAFVLPDGRQRVLYASGVAIGEAESTDGRTWRRVDPEPILGPAPPAPPGYLLPNEKGPFDTAGVSDPCASVRTTPAGRLHVRVLYTGLDPSGATTIGLAARYGTAGKLVRQSSPVYAAGQHEAAPAIVEAGSGVFLYVQQERSNTSLGGNRTTYAAIAAAFAPANVHLPEPGDFPDDP